MIYIHEPVTDWEITVVELVDNTDDMPGRKYFEKPDSYSVAISLAYNVPRPHPDKYNPLLIGRLSLYYEDRFSKPIYEFESVHDFVTFLEMHPPLAKCVEYTKKEKK